MYKNRVVLPIQLSGNEELFKFIYHMLSSKYIFSNQVLNSQFISSVQIMWDIWDNLKPQPYDSRCFFLSASIFYGYFCTSCFYNLSHPYFVNGMVMLWVWTGPFYGIGVLMICSSSLLLLLVKVVQLDWFWHRSICFRKTREVFNVQQILSRLAIMWFICQAKHFRIILSK